MERSKQSRNFKKVEMYFIVIEISNKNNGIHMSSSIDFFGKMGIKNGRKIEIKYVSLLVLVIIWWRLCLIF